MEKLSQENEDQNSTINEPPMSKENALKARIDEYLSKVFKKRIETLETVATEFDKDISELSQISQELLAPYKDFKFEKPEKEKPKPVVEKTDKKVTEKKDKPEEKTNTTKTVPTKAAPSNQPNADVKTAKRIFRYKPSQDCRRTEIRYNW